MKGVEVETTSSEIDKTHLENLEGAHQRLVDGHHRTGIVKLATVVGRREQRDQLPFSEKFITILNNLEKHTQSVTIPSYE